LDCIRESADIRCLAGQDGLHTCNLVIALVPRWPSGGGFSSRLETGEDIKKTRTRQGRGGVEVEVEHASVALRRGREVEGNKRRDVTGLPILEDFPVWRVEVDSPGGDRILREGRRWNDVWTGGDVRDWRCMCENEEGKGSGEIEELHDG